MINKDVQFIYNNIDDQNLLYARDLTIRKWNFIINSLKNQANANTKYIENLHTWLLGGFDSFSTPSEILGTYENFYSFVTSNISNILKGIKDLNTKNTQFKLQIDANVTNIKNNLKLINELRTDLTNIGFSTIPNTLTESQVLELWTNKPDGRYNITSETYGPEILILYHEKNLFKRMTGEADYTYDFKKAEWKLASGAGGSMNEIDGVLSEEEIVALWDAHEQGEYPDGFYTITSQMYGKEMIVMTRQLVIEGETDDFGNPKDARLFKRITGEYDYTYDFELEQWEVASGAGGTGGGNVVIIARNPEQTVATTADNTEIKFFFRPSTGKTGTYTIYVNGAFKQSSSIESGERTIPISKDWLTAGTNEVTLEIVDNATVKGTATFYINGIKLGLRSNFVESAPYSGIFNFSYIPEGVVDKTLYLYIDKGTSNEIKIEKELSSVQSGGLLTESFTTLTHGLHTIYAIMRADVNGKPIESNVLSYNLIYYTSSGTDTIISSKFNTTSAEQGQLLSIDYFVYDPTNDRPVVSLFINDEWKKDQEFKGVKDSFDITDYSSGTSVKFTLKAGNATKDFYVNVEESEIKIETVKEGLVLELTAFGRSNSEGNGRDNWSYGDVVAKLSDFNWGSNGWITVNNETCLRLNGKADVYIPYNIFEKDISVNGLTIEVEYSSRDVYDVNKILLSCYSNNRGILILPNEASFKSELSTIKTKFKEDEKIKVSFIIQPNNASSLRLIKTFINGVFSGVIQYSVNDNFKQAIPEGITINANDGAIDIYSIRVYDFALTDTQILNNYIADMPLEQRMLYYNKNNIIENETVKYALVKPLIPVLTITGPLPLTKGDKKTVSVTYEVPNSFIGVCGYSFITDNVIIDIQGTSSVAYPRKNYKLKYPEPFAFYEGAVPEKVYTMKADYMESSHSHNTGNGILMTQFSPMFPTQTADNGVRNSIYGFPVVIFHKETNESLPVYYGVFNFNNDKGNSDTLGLTTDKAESWEFKDNALPLCVFDLPVGVTNFSNYFESNKTAAFEARYPEDYTNFNNLKRVINWVYNVKPDAATNNILSNSVSFNFEEKIVLQQERYVEGSLTHTTYNFYIEKDSKKQYLNISLENNAPVFKFITDTKQQYTFDTSMNAWYVRMSGWPYYLCYYEDTKKLFAVTESELNSGDYSNYKFVEFPEAEDDSIPSLQLVVDVTYTHTEDTKLYRQQKFKTEFSQYFNIEFCLFYYVMMDVVLAVDSRAKNMFLDTLDGKIWYPRWYDMDTTYGLDNVGYNKYGYGLEQTDYIDENNNIIDPETQTGSPVYGGVDSVLWNIFGTTFKNEIADYYIDLRDNKGLSYESILDILKGRQIDKISAAMYNTDGDFKYIGPLVEDNDVENLYIAQGSRLNHLQWWVQNRLNYLDSKYRTNDFLTDTITMRVYKVSNPVVPNTFDYDLVPYNDSYCLVRYGNDVWKEKRGKANQHTVINADTDFGPKNGQEIYIYNAGSLLSIGDLSGKYAARMDFTRAFKLKELIIGNSTPGYYNDKLYELHIGNLPMLEELNITNCSTLKHDIVLSNCLNIKKVYARGTKITTITFADGGNLEELELPETVASIKLLNQPFLNTFIMDGADKQYENLSSLWIENVPGIDTRPIISNARNLNRLRLVGINWKLANFEQEILIYLTSGKLIGIDANGKDLPKPYVNGKIHIMGTVARRQLDEWNNYFREYGLVITADNPEISYEVRFVNWDGTLLQTKYVLPGGTVVYTGDTPTKDPTDGYFNVFIGWDKPLTNIQANTVLTAEFRTDKPSRLVISLDSVDFLKPTIRIGNFKGQAIVDWGDNTQVETFNIEGGINSYSNYYDMTHIYSATGNYIIEVLLQGTRKNQTYQNDLSETTSSSEWHCDISLWNTGDGPGSYYSSRLTECELQEGIYDRLHPMLLRLSQVSTFTVPSSIDFIGGAASIDASTENHSYDGGYSNVFYKCPNLTKVIILNPETKIGAVNSGYSECPLLHTVILKNKTGGNSIYIPNTTTKLPNYYLKNCKAITDVRLPINLIEIGDHNFYNLSQLPIIEIPRSVEKIGSYFGYSCTLIEQIVLPPNLKQLSNNVLSNTPKLTNVYYYNDLLNWCNINFGTTILNGNITFKLLRKTYDPVTGEVISEEYYEPENITIPAEVITIGEYQFAHWRKLKKCVLHKNVRYIKARAFSNCVLLEDINITDDINEIKESAFANCQKITSITIPVNITEIPSSCFSACAALETVTFSPNSKLLTIGSSAFSSTAIKNLVLPETVKRIENSAFSSSKIETINLPNSIEYLGSSVFYNCSKLSEITIPVNITEIPGSFCWGCYGLDTVYFHNSVVKIGSGAFNGCSDLIDITLPPSLEFIDHAGLRCGANEKTNITFTSPTPPEIYGLDDSSPSLPSLTYISSMKVLAGYTNVYKTNTSYIDYSSKIIDNGVGFGPVGVQWLLLNGSNDIEVPFGNSTGGTPEFTVSSNNTDILTVGKMVESTTNPGYAKFTATSSNIKGSVEITATITANGITSTTTFRVDVYNEIPLNSYEVVPIFGTPYSFELNADGYYESKNKGKDSSYAICRVDIFSYGGQKMYVDCISHGEPYADYGILSKLNTKLKNSNEDDTTLTDENTGTAQNVYKTFKGLSSQYDQTVDYGVLEKGSYYILIKYRKDKSQNQYADTLRFKVKFEKVTT